MVFLMNDGLSVKAGGADGLAAEKKKITVQKWAFSRGSTRWYTARNKKQRQHIQ